MTIVRWFLLFLLSALLCFGENFKLYLKDGNYHIVREYHVEGDRVRFYSTERDEWEEIPLALLDLDKTEKLRDAKKQQIAKEAREQDAEDAAAREQRHEIESIPMDTGAYYRVNDQVKTLDAAQYQVVTNKKREALKIMSPVPLVAGKASVIIPGEHSKFVVHEDRPNFYFRPEKQERFGIIRITPKKSERLIENVSIVPVTNQALQDRKQVEVFQQQLQGNLYKVWPEKPLEPGEYAVVEFDDGDENTKGEIELLVWDFAYQP